ncbi:MAG: glycosyltransferase family 4 protein [Desulfuromonadales bacterium]|nr:glycosyltransferase family 4 protein [Desulfuromonadales bacterium]
MRILYDHQIFSSQVYGGISRYFYELLSRLAENPEMDLDLALRFSNNSYLSGSSFANPGTFFKDKKFIGKTTLLDFLNGQKSREGLLKREYDVFHPTYYNPYFLKHIGGKPYVVTVYDMVHELYPEIYPSSDRTREWKLQSLKNASKIIAISENTRQDIIRIYGLDEQKVQVIHLASSLQSLDSSVPAPLPGKYLLYVGQRVRYKNFSFFIRAVAPLMKQDSDLAIICAGGGGFSPEESAIFESFGIAGRVRQLSVPDETLIALYENARALVFPSLYEGFGIPILEAFACGCPVVLAEASCFPEVAGDAALYFDPRDEGSLRAVLVKVVGDESLRADMRSRGFIRGRAFSWDKTASETKTVYESLL